MVDYAPMPVTPVDTPVANTEYAPKPLIVTVEDGTPDGDAALLQAGTDTEPRAWSAKDIADEIERRISEI